MAAPGSVKARRMTNDDLAYAKEILETEARAIEAVRARLGESFLRALDLIGGCRGQVVVTGGYASAVARRFVERGTDWLDGALSADELAAAFFGAAGCSAGEPGAEPDAPDPLYAGLLATRYGGGS